MVPFLMDLRKGIQLLDQRVPQNIENPRTSSIPGPLEGRSTPKRRVPRAGVIEMLKENKVSALCRIQDPESQPSAFREQV